MSHNISFKSLESISNEISKKFIPEIEEDFNKGNTLNSSLQIFNFLATFTDPISFERAFSEIHNILLQAKGNTYLKVNTELEERLNNMNLSNLKVKEWLLKQSPDIMKLGIKSVILKEDKHNPIIMENVVKSFDNLLNVKLNPNPYQIDNILNLLSPDQLKNIIVKL